MRRLGSRWLVLMAVLLGVGCSNGFGPWNTTVGTYTLRTTNGTSVPYMQVIRLTSTADSIVAGVARGSCELAGDQTWRIALTSTESGRGYVTTKVYTYVGTFTSDGDSLRFSGKLVTAFSGTARAGTLTLVTRGLPPLEDPTTAVFTK